MINQALVNTT